MVVGGGGEAGPPPGFAGGLCEQETSLGPSPAGPRCPCLLPQRQGLGLGSPLGREEPPRMKPLLSAAAET